MQDLLPPERRRQAEKVVRECGDAWLDPARSAKSFDVADREDIEWINRRCVSHLFGTTKQVLRLTRAWENVAKKMCIKATSYTRSPYRPCAERAKDDPCWRYFERDSGHDVMVGDSNWLPDFLGRMSEDWDKRGLKPAIILARFGKDVMRSFFYGAQESKSLCLVLRTD